MPEEWHHQPKKDMQHNIIDIDWEDRKANLPHHSLLIDSFSLLVLSLFLNLSSIHSLSLLRFQSFSNPSHLTSPISPILFWLYLWELAETVRTILVPYSIAWAVWNVPCLHVRPWQITLVFSSMKTAAELDMARGIRALLLKKEGGRPRERGAQCGGEHRHCGRSWPERQVTAADQSFFTGYFLQKKK